MFFVPGEIISVITFPGVIVHELAHQLFCRFYKIAVMKVCYYRYGNPAGYVIHEPVQRVLPQIMISTGPFFLNSILGAFIAAPAMPAVMTFESGSPLDYFLAWLGISIAMHAFPSRGDAQSLWRGVRQTAFWKQIVVAPIVGLIYVGSLGSMVWLDAIYGIAVAVALPNLLIHLIY